LAVLYCTWQKLTRARRQYSDRSIQHCDHYSAADSGAEYCDERVCVCVCVCAIISSELYTSDLHQISVHGSVLLWRRSDTLRTSGFIFFIDDVIFAHALRLLDVAARLR